MLFEGWGKWFPKVSWLCVEGWIQLDVGFASFGWAIILLTLSFEVVLCHSWQSLFVFHDSQWSRMGYFKSINFFVWYRFHLKPSIRIVAIYGAYKWPKFFIYPPGEISFLSPCSYQSNLVSIYGRFSPQVLEMFSISPQQACSFVVDFPTTLINPYF